VARTFGASALARVIAAACSLVQVPLAIAHLGSQAYGLWMTLTGIWALLNFTDLGLGLALQNQMSAAWGRDDQPAMKGLLRHGLLRLVQLAAGLAVVLVPLAWLIDWPRLLNLTDAGLARDLPAAMTLVVLGFCLNLPLSAAARLAAAAQKTWLPPLWNCAASAATLAGVGLAVLLHGGFLIFLTLSLALPALQNLGLGLHVWRLLAWRDLTPSPPSPDQRQALWREGLKFFTPQAGALFAQSALPAAIAIVARPELVTQFNLLQRLFGLATQAQGMALSALWPAYAEAQARGDREWIRRSFAFSLKVTAAFVAGLALVTWQIDLILRLWLRADAPHIDPVFTLTIALWTGGLMIGSPFAALLGGLGHATGMAIYGTISHVLALAGMAWWGPRTGAIGVVAASAAAYLLLNLPCTITESLRRLRTATGPAP
jgi:O-antigen/teichoic acid export membrane protein